MFSCSNASYNVGDYYAGSQNDTTTNVYYLNNFDDLLRSYGEWGGGEGGSEGGGEGGREGGQT